MVVYASAVLYDGSAQALQDHCELFSVRWRSCLLLLLPCSRCAMECPNLIFKQSHMFIFWHNSFPALLHSLKTIISSLQKNRKEEDHVGKNILVDREKCRGNQTASSCAQAESRDRLTSSVSLISQPTRQILCGLKDRTRGFSLQMEQRTIYNIPNRHEQQSG